jgi:catechol 2,3-dioxygenase-like lactoylglutathione lyase family enzyme
MIQYKRTDHVNICVAPDQLEEARAFYADVLGFEPITRPDVSFHTPGYWFTVAGIEWHIGIEKPVERSFRHTAFEVADLDASRKHLEAHGVQLFEEPLIPNRRRFTFLDPFGIRMEFLEYGT